MKKINLHTIFIIILFLFSSTIAQAQIIFSDDFNRQNGPLGEPWVLLADTLFIQNSHVVGPSNQYGRVMYNLEYPVQNLTLNVDFNFMDDNDSRFQFFIIDWVDTVAYIAKIHREYFGLWGGPSETLLIQSNLQLSLNTLYKMRLKYNCTDGIISLLIIDNQDIFIDSLGINGPTGNFNTIMLGIENSAYSTKWFDNVILQKSEVVSVEEEHDIISLPERFKLYHNYPNPFNPNTTITYNLSNPNFITLKIFNLAGQQIVTLVNDYQTAGEYQIKWNANGLPSGIYFYKLQSSEYTKTKKLILQK